MHFLLITHNSPGTLRRPFFVRVVVDVDVELDVDVDLCIPIVVGVKFAKTVTV